MVNDMTNGSIVRKLINFSIPVVMGLLLQQLYNLVDTAIVGQTLGALALGGVGSTGAINFLIIGFCNGLCSGMALPVAQAFGAGSYSTMRGYIANSCWLGIIVSIGLLVVVLPFTGAILQLTNTPAEQFKFAYHYIFIVFCGIPATILYNLSSGFLRALGDSKTPLMFLMVAAGVNIGLDLILIIVLGMGVEGAAIATVSAQLASGVFCILFMAKHFDILKMKPNDLHPDKAKIKVLLTMGVPMGIQYSITAIGSVILQSAVNSLGAVYVSAHSVATKVNVINTSLYDGIGIASANFTGQNLGAEKYSRIKKGTLVCCGMSLAVWVFFTTLILIVQGGVTNIFVNPEEAAQISSLVFMNCLLYISFGPLLTIVDVIRSDIQGMGYSGLAMFAGVMELIGRTVIGLWLIPAFGYIAACFASPLAWLLADSFLIPAYIYCFRKISIDRLNSAHC